MTRDPRTGPKPPLPGQQQTPPGTAAAMHPAPDHGERSSDDSSYMSGSLVPVTGGCPML
jgi:hypothetical protein